MMWTAMCGSVRRRFSSGVDKTLLSKLRKKTGFPFINCRKALDQFDNDFDKAEKWLREQAQKEGWAKVSKLGARPMSQGLVGVIADQNSATMIEVNCETDFVARNEKFVGLVSRVVGLCQQHFARHNQDKVYVDGPSLGALPTDYEGHTLADMVALEVGNVGENMALRRAVHVRAASNASLSAYVHASGTPMNTGSDCQLGRFGTLVELQRHGPTPEDAESSTALSLEDLGKQLCQHIVGFNPREIGNLEEVTLDPEIEEQDEDEGREGTEGDGENKDGENKDGDNKDGESEEEEEKEETKEERKEKEDEMRLVHQEFLLDDSVKVGQLLIKQGVKINQFVRFECGEELESEKS